MKSDVTRKNRNPYPALRNLPNRIDGAALENGAKHMTRHDDIRANPPFAAADMVRLRLLATSDLHASILPFDYATNRATDGFGLARTASLITEARRDGGACLLLDNGDFLQGTPLGDPDGEDARAAPNPVIAAMNTLGYDAVALGNHEFNFGIGPLRAALSDMACPVICANALTRRGATVEEDETLVPPSVILTREVTGKDGRRHALRIALLGLLPPQITTWDRFHLDDAVVTRDMVETAAARIPLLRASGADLVVLLAHTGPGGSGPPRGGMENAALALAQLPGVDAIIAGHSHQVFPAPGAAESPGMNRASGTFHGIPAVMPGVRGSHLGVIDLYLARARNGWRVTGHKAETRPVMRPDDAVPAPPDPGIVATVRDRHQATLRRLATTVGTTSRPIHSYLSRLRGDLPVRLVAEATRQAVTEMLADGPFAGLPVLATAAPYSTGGRAGPAAFTDIPAGPLTLRNITDLCPFPNTLCALWLTGAEIRDWLERAASGFHRILPGVPDQPLLDTAFPGHAIDTIAGLSYRVDPAGPALYDATGTPRPSPTGRAPGRIRALSLAGRPLDPGARVVLAVTSYRAFGGGPYPALPTDRLILASRTRVRDAVTAFVLAGRHEALDTGPVWSLLPVGDATAVIETGPGLRAHRDEIAALGLDDMGLTPAGFLRLRLPLADMACESGV